MKSNLAKTARRVVKAFHRATPGRDAALRRPQDHGQCGSHWIPVTDEMPDSDTTVLIACIGGSEPVWLGYHDGEAWWFEGLAGPAQVTHWQHLPEPPNPADRRDHALEHCPNCGCDDIGIIKQDSLGTEAWQQVDCRRCGLEWQEVFHFAHLAQGDGEPWPPASETHTIIAPLKPVT